MAEFVRAKFDIQIGIEQLRGLKEEQVRQLILEKTAAKYKQREIEYPVEFAMNMVYGPQGANVYGFEALSAWAKKKYEIDLPVEQIQQLKPNVLYKKLLEISEGSSDGQLERQIEEKVSRLGAKELIQWANERFGTSFTEETIGDGDIRREKVLEAGRQFLRSELNDLEKYVLLQVYDGAWKDHLYAMDHLKSSIHLRALAEKDPKTEYKQEGFRMFDEMLGVVEDRVTDIIFKIRLEAGVRARSVWNVSRVEHNEVGQFEMAERQRAAAQAPQGEVKVKQIVLEKPKVGRNDPCPCGSGKKYKKCHGKNA